MELLLTELRSGQERVRGRIETGDPAAAVVRVAAHDRHDLIVMGTHGRTGVTRWLMGSVAENVLRHAHCPVLIVRGEEASNG